MSFSFCMINCGYLGNAHTQRSEAEATAIYADGKQFLDLYLELTGMSLRLVIDLLLKNALWHS